MEDKLVSVIVYYFNDNQYQLILGNLTNKTVETPSFLVGTLSTDQMVTLSKQGIVIERVPEKTLPNSIPSKGNRENYHANIALQSCFLTKSQREQLEREYGVVLLERISDCIYLAKVTSSQQARSCPLIEELYDIEPSSKLPSDWQSPKGARWIYDIIFFKSASLEAVNDYLESIEKKDIIVVYRGRDSIRIQLLHPDTTIIENIVKFNSVRSIQEFIEPQSFTQ